MVQTIKYRFYVMPHLQSYESCDHYYRFFIPV